MPKTNEELHLGHKLQEAIDSKGVSQADVARYFGVKPPTVSNDWLVHGRIGKKHYPKLVEYFGLPYEWWFGAAGADPKINAVMLQMLKMTEKEKSDLSKQCAVGGKQKKNSIAK